MFNKQLADDLGLFCTFSIFYPSNASTISQIKTLNELVKRNIPIFELFKALLAQGKVFTNALHNHEIEPVNNLLLLSLIECVSVLLMLLILIVFNGYSLTWLPYVSFPIKFNLFPST